MLCCCYDCWAGNFACDSRVRVGRPKNEEELAALVGQWNKVKVS